MKIKYLGHASFCLSANGLSVITDPYQGVGYEMPKNLRADIVTISHAHFDHNYLTGVTANTVYTDLGVHQYDDIKIEGIASYHDERKGALRGNNCIYKIEMGGLTLCHMGDIGEEVSSELIDKIGKVDVLFIPVGGTYTVDAVGAMKYVEAIQPKTVIPMHYKPMDGSLDIAGIQSFLELCKKEDILYVPEGSVEINKNTRGVIYMERIKI